MPGKERAKFVAIVKAKFSYCSPFRLGTAVGEAGANLPCPYRAGSRGEYAYWAGVEYGMTKASPGEHQPKPDGYAVVQPDGGFVGIWRERESAERVMARSPNARGGQVRPMFFLREGTR